MLDVCFGSPDSQKKTCTCSTVYCLCIGHMVHFASSQACTHAHINILRMCIDVCIVYILYTHRESHTDTPKQVNTQLSSKVGKQLGCFLKGQFTHFTKSIIYMYLHPLLVVLSHADRFALTFQWKSQFKECDSECVQSQVFTILERSWTCLESSASAWCLAAVWAKPYTTEALCPAFLLSLCYENYCIRSSQCVCKESIKSRLNCELSFSVGH